MTEPEIEPSQNNKLDPETERVGKLGNPGTVKKITAYFNKLDEKTSSRKQNKNNILNKNKGGGVKREKTWNLRIFWEFLGEVETK